eukprot:84039-Rhodomonas_salina.1
MGGKGTPLRAPSLSTSFSPSHGTADSYRHTLPVPGALTAIGHCNRPRAGEYNLKRGPAERSPGRGFTGTGTPSPSPGAKLSVEGEASLTASQNPRGQPEAPLLPRAWHWHARARSPT